MCLSHPCRSMLSISVKITNLYLAHSLTAIQLSQHIFVFISCFQIHARCCREGDEYLAHRVSVIQHEPIYICVYLMLSDLCWVLRQRWQVPCSQCLKVSHLSQHIFVFVSCFQDTCWVLPWRWQVPCSQSHSKSTWANSICVYLMLSDPCWVLRWRWWVSHLQSHLQST